VIIADRRAANIRIAATGPVMPKLISVGSMCERMAALAGGQHLKSLSMWLKLAANEAYLNNLQMEAACDERIGVWDWDVGNNVTCTNAAGGAMFGKRPGDATKANPLETYTAVIHPDDYGHFAAHLDRSVKSGAAFFSEYRVVVNGAVRWIRADGNCTFDPSGRLARMLGSVIDITRERLATNVVALR
jgi:PAS domain-containing protein